MRIRGTDNDKTQLLKWEQHLAYFVSDFVCITYIVVDFKILKKSLIENVQKNKTSFTLAALCSYRIIIKFQSYANTPETKQVTMAASRYNFGG